MVRAERGGREERNMGEDVPERRELVLRPVDLLDIGDPCASVDGDGGGGQVCDVVWDLLRVVLRIADFAHGDRAFVECGWLAHALVPVRPDVDAARAALLVFCFCGFQFAPVDPGRCSHLLDGEGDVDRVGFGTVGAGDVVFLLAVASFGVGLVVHCAFA